MDPVTLALVAIGGIRTLLANPLIGGGHVKAQEASDLLGILGSLLQQGDDGLDDLRAFTSEIESMASAGRGPTPTEWEIMRARSAEAADRIDAVVEELLEEEEPPTSEPTPAPEENAEAGEGEGESHVAPV